MARYRPYDYDQLVMVPVSLEDQLAPGTLEHTIHYVVENRLDLSDFDELYHNDETGRTAYDPRVLVKVVLLGYARGLISSRKLERACRENIVFMALACGQAPDHSTIASFISEMGLERIERFLAQNEPKQGRRGREIQSNVTDNESAKMKTSHGILQGYNANALIDAEHQVVVHAEAFGDGDDGTNAAPMLQGASHKLAVVEEEAEPLKDAVIRADTSYYSVENLEACREAGVDAYIPDRQFRQRDPRFAEARRHRRPTDRHKQPYRSRKRSFSPEDFRWDDRQGRLICPAGVALYKSGTNIETADGYFTDAYKAPRTACRTCRLRRTCLRNPESDRGRQVRIFHGRRPGSLLDAMKQKIDTPEGRKIYSRRLGTVEPVFGNLSAQKGMDRFTLRGRAKVNIQWKLYCMVHNLETIGHYGPSWN